MISEGSVNGAETEVIVKYEEKLQKIGGSGSRHSRGADHTRRERR